MDAPLIVDAQDRVATVTLNRPEARNALSAALLACLAEAMGDLDYDTDIDVVILTGADPAFCAGLDLKELGSGTRGNTLGDFSRANGTTGPFRAMSKPVIGAINGVAVTGGLELALACDFLIASDRARFADTHARVGIQPGWGLTVLLPEAIGYRRARQMSATGNYIDAACALAWGLVNQVVDHDDLLASAQALASDIASNDQRAVHRILTTYDENILAANAQAWANESKVFADWNGGRFSADEIERRRSTIAERGRKQL